ncbi:hypothetical protein SAMN05428971_3619 [Candidatus Pantoea varia]|uniref:Pilin (Type 1 fimbria component protein) n=1 Tax=Candidatus Pantoea varia TaxID=1881036 RepID=A0A1I5G8B4_9GAMM|nr:hypothetical protein [Pantoea varia]SFO32260.1 hypothetical protein SAMN05428971_3619 [Pantoea varia]
MKQCFYLALVLTTSFCSLATAHAACQIQLSEPQVNYGAMTRGELVQHSGNSLSANELQMGDKRDLDLMVTCDRPTLLTLSFNGPAKDAESYRFGEHGRATLTLHNVMIDDRPASIESNGKRESKMAFVANNTLRFWKDDAPAIGSLLRARVTVTTWISSGATRVGESQYMQLEGSFVAGQ